MANSNKVGGCGQHWIRPIFNFSFVFLFGKLTKELYETPCCNLEVIPLSKLGSHEKSQKLGEIS